MSGDGGGANNTNSNSGGTGDQDKETVSKADHQRALDDMMKFKKDLQTERETNSNLKTRLEALETEKKSSAGDFKSLYEQTKSQLEEKSQSYDKLKGNLVLTQKYSEVQKEVSKLGLKTEFIPMLEKENLDSLQFETTSQGRFIVHGADVFAQDFKKRFPSAFDTAKAPNINSGGGAGGGGNTDDNAEITPSMLFQCEQACKTKGDMAPYHAMLTKRLAQLAEKNKK